MRSLLFAIAIFFCYLSGSSQNFSRAKITTSRNETIECFIKNTTYEGTPQIFSYSLTMDGQLVSIRGTEVNKIEFENGAIYEKHSINVPVIFYDYLERNMAQYDVEANYLKGYRIVEKLISGPVDLYQFIDSFQHSHFFYYTQSDSEIVLLPYKTYVDNTVIHYDNNYKNLLIFLSTLNQCGKSSLTRIENSKYSVDDMIRIFKEINRCAGLTVKSNNPIYSQHGQQIRFGILGGLSLTSLHYKAVNGFYPGLTENSFPNSTMPMIGVYIDILPVKKIRNYLMTLELYYHMYKSETDSIKANPFTSSIGFVKFSTCNFSPNARFFLKNVKKVKPFLEGGINISAILSKEDHYDSYSGSQKSSFPIFGDKGMDVMLGAGGGLDFNKFSASLRYQFSVTNTTSYYNFLSLLAKLNLTK